MILAHVSQFVPHTASLAAFFQDQQQVGFSIVDMWHNMGWLPKGVVFLLLIMSVWSLAVMIDR
ncbi:MAG: flagellar motor protein MotA, partial [Acidobacteriaceae bacterium]